MVLKEAICDFPLCQMYSNKKMSCDAVVVLCLLGCVCVCHLCLLLWRPFCISACESAVFPEGPLSVTDLHPVQNSTA